MNYYQVIYSITCVKHLTSVIVFITKLTNIKAMKTKKEIRYKNMEMVIDF